MVLRKVWWWLVWVVTFTRIDLYPPDPKAEKKQIEADLKICEDELKDIRKDLDAKSKAIAELEEKAKADIRAGREVDRSVMEDLERVKEQKKHLLRRQRIQNQKTVVLQGRHDTITLHVDAQIPQAGKAFKVASDRLPQQLAALSADRDGAIVDREDKFLSLDDVPSDTSEEIERSLREQVAAEGQKNRQQDTPVAVRDEPDVVRSAQDAKAVIRLAEATEPPPAVPEMPRRERAAEFPEPEAG